MRRGQVLAELLVAAALGLVVTASATALLRDARRVAWRADARRDARAQLAQAEAVLRAELRGLSGEDTAPEGGDLLLAQDTVIELRARIGSAVACAGSSATQIELPGESAPGAPPFVRWGAAPDAGDRVLVHDAGFLPDTSDDRWHARAVRLVEAGSCTAGAFAAAAASGAPRWRLHLDAPLPTPAAEGAPVVVTRRRRYALYRGGDGGWYLGQREGDARGLLPPQPVAGPLAAPTEGGLQVEALDTAARVVPSVVGTDVAALRIALRAVRGRGAWTVRDSVLLALRLRGGGLPW